MKKISFLIIIFLLFNYCNHNIKQKSKDYKGLTFFTMDTIVEIKYKGDNQKLENKIKKEFERIYNKFSPSVKTGVLYKINHKIKDKIIIDNETKYLIEKSDYFSNLSNGIFDITIKPVIDLWGFENTDKHYSIPKDNELKEKLKLVNYKRISVKNNYLYIPENYKIDLGGIAKGYAVDKVSKIFKEYDINDFLINAGGDLMAKGRNPDGEKWKIGIQNPREAGIIKIIEINNKAVATSGDYQRYFIKNGIRYHHIISPRTGMPFRKWISMTIIANKCIESDTLATMFFGMDIRTIKKIIGHYPTPVKYYAISSEKKIYTNLQR